MKHTSMTYAMKNNILTCVSDVERGLKCGCVCPSCGETLVAHKGEKTAHHFKHYNSEECYGGYQTSLHLLAKEILSNESSFVIPPVIYHLNNCGNLISLPAREIAVDKIELEKRTGDIIPDIVIHSGGKVLLIEIYVSHKVDVSKLEKIKSLGLSTIEIDLSKKDREITKADLRQLLVNDCEEKQWVFNNYVEKWKKRLYSVSKELKVTDRGIMRNHVDYCPKKARMWRGKPYANLVEDCFYCEYLIEITREEYQNDKDNPEIRATVRCVGDRKIQTLEDLKRVLSQKSGNF